MSKKVDTINNDLLRLAPTRTAAEFYAMEKLQRQRATPAAKALEMREVNPMPPQLMHDVAMPEIRFLAFLLQTDAKFHEIARERSRLKDIIRRVWARFMENRQAAKIAYERETRQHIDLARIKYHTFLTHFLAMREVWQGKIAHEVANSEYAKALGRHDGRQQTASLEQRAANTVANTAMKNIHATHASIESAQAHEALMHRMTSPNGSDLSMGVAVAMSTYQQQLATWQAVAKGGEPASVAKTTPHLKVKATS